MRKFMQLGIMMLLATALLLAGCGPGEPAGPGDDPMGPEPGDDPEPEPVPEPGDDPEPEPIPEPGDDIDDMPDMP